MGQVGGPSNDKDKAELQARFERQEKKIRQMEKEKEMMKEQMEKVMKEQLRQMKEQNDMLEKQLRQNGANPGESSDRELIVPLVDPGRVRTEFRGAYIERDNTTLEKIVRLGRSAAAALETYYAPYLSFFPVQRVGQDSLFRGASAEGQGICALLPRWVGESQWLPQTGMV